MTRVDGVSAARVGAQVIDGKAVAGRIRDSVARRVASLKAGHGVVPSLAVVLVGEDPPSQIYVRNKTRRAEEAGMNVHDVVMAASAAQDQVMAVVAELNADAGVHAILVQLPLPPQISPEDVLDALDPAKDVDGLHVINTGLLVAGCAGVVPATPLGCLALIRQVRDDLEGLDAVVIGRSNLVGKPVAQLLLREHCSVTTVHTRTRNLDEICRRADILVAAAGRPGLVRGSWIKPGATVIDVGINRIEPAGGGEGRIVGDVAFGEAVQVAGAITPVPGGVGPMTIACLLQNTLLLACRYAGVPVPEDPGA